MSESRRYAEMLSSVRGRSFEGRYDVETSKARLQAVLPRDEVSFDADRVVVRAGAARFEGRWVAGPLGMRLEGSFLPRASTRVQLMGISLFLTLMIVGSIASVLSEGGNERYILPGLTAVASLLVMPFLVLAMGSAREGDESRLERAMRVALEDLDPKMPPPRKWKDEE
jgi:hypothetical protein